MAFDSRDVEQEIMNILAAAGDSFTFRVIGIPASKGSKTAMAIKQKSAPASSSNKSKNKSGYRAVMIEVDKKLPTWTELVKSQAKRAIPENWTFSSGDGQIYALFMLFYFARPAYHFNVRGELLNKYSGSKYKGSQPDADKCVRAVGDALTGLAYADDAQLVAPFPIKLWCPPGRLPGATITVKKIVTG